MLAWLCAVLCAGAAGWEFGLPPTVGGLNIQLDIKAEIAQLVRSGKLAPPPARPRPPDPWQRDPPPEQPADPVEPPEPEPEPIADGKMFLKQRELTVVVKSSEQQGFRQILAESGGEDQDRARSFDDAWQNKVLGFICRRYGLTLEMLPKALAEFERDEEVQRLLRRYNAAMSQLKRELASSAPPGG